MGPTDSCTMLFNPITHGEGESLYNVVQPHDPWRGCTVVQHCTTPSPMERVGHCIMLYNPMSHGAHTSLYNAITHGAHTLLYNPMTHGDLYLLYNVVWPHDPWGFVTIAVPMTHGEKVAEGARCAPSIDNMRTESYSPIVPSRTRLMCAFPQRILSKIPMNSPDASSCWRISRVFSHR